MFFWIERYLFYPDTLAKIISFTLLPLSFLYCTLTYLKKFFSTTKNYGIPVISIGNLIVGGSGKTPFAIKLSSYYKNSAIVLRGYKRDSHGLYIVSERGDIKVDISISGDEAMELAKATSSTIIVSEDRVKGIKKAKELGCDVVFLDDGFSKFSIKKFNILLKPKEDFLPFCLPSGPYRFAKSNYQKVDLTLQEEVDFSREVTIQNPSDTMLLLTAISKPQRLDKYLPSGIKKIYLPDHSEFSQEFIDLIMIKNKPKSILTTKKDAVKLEKFNLNLSILELDIKIQDTALTKIDSYIKGYTQ